MAAFKAGLQIVDDKSIEEATIVFNASFVAPFAQERRYLLRLSYDFAHALMTMHPELIPCHRTILGSIFSHAAGNLNFSTAEIDKLHEKACELFPESNKTLENFAIFLSSSQVSIQIETFQAPVQIAYKPASPYQSLKSLYNLPDA